MASVRVASVRFVLVLVRVVRTGACLVLGRQLLVVPSAPEAVVRGGCLGLGDHLLLLGDRLLLLGHQLLLLGRRLLPLQVLLVGAGAPRDGRPGRRLLPQVWGRDLWRVVGAGRR